ncbi:MAG: InlB B-repeat-containing protein [Lachnospiraceae bacterium]|nr:InlB B-repeat-containing protein [Lachnospiraceae bacterium]
MKKRWVILLSNILSIILIAISLSGCKLFQSRDPWKKKQIDGEFYYYVKNESAIILGLVDEEKEREELVMPEILGGYPVKQIGELFTASVGSRTKHYGIDATNIDRIVINHKCEIDMYQSIINLTGELIINSDVRISTSNRTDIKYIVLNIDKNALTYYKELSELWEYDWMKIVEYNATGGSQETYSVLLSSGMIMKEPKQPTNEGYMFDGWYINEEYTTKWNFKTDVVTENITLYAKWN